MPTKHKRRRPLRVCAPLKTQLLLTLVFGIVLVLPAAPTLAQEQPYDYPFVNPYEATVLGTPSIYQAELPARVPTQVFHIDPQPEHQAPAIFWHEDTLEFSLVRQQNPAPLIFIIAGTGATYKASKMRMMQRAFYQAGFHVISLSSPTVTNFIASSSTSGMPGHLEEDAEDLYRVMAMALEEAGESIDVTSHFLTGYSLGAIQAAFIAKLDETRHQFDFDKVLMINPPVNLYESVNVLDRLLEENIPGGMDNFGPWFDGVMTRLAEINREMAQLDLSEDTLYELYKHYPLSTELLSAMIGLSFRVSSANLVFSADAMNGGGYIIPEGAQLTSNTPLTDYLITALRIRFSDYFRDLFYPYFRKQEPQLTEQTLISRMSLREIEPFLRSRPDIGLIHNEDDIIMAPGDIEWLRQVFGDRAKIYPKGGHCGNMAHRDNVAHMVRFFGAEQTDL
ncbi:alpha/beta fold hydrolase [Marinobacter adhaerens]|uniref:Alpha/beta fold hydrolase n=1 Tax=Marinobacter adhaerens TaxID=1033846 RepID=A0A851HQ11_9GAMM|nr:alpha/beta fold hydrolase [Marinobacter adhaerens]NWN91093.1 alpha/beta fold hydrolase [Marinobacter adhaerens]